MRGSRVEEKSKNEISGKEGTWKHQETLDKLLFTESFSWEKRLLAKSKNQQELFNSSFVILSHQVKSGPNITSIVKMSLFITELQKQKGFFEITILTQKILNGFK